jgi:DUF1365 family protein
VENAFEYGVYQLLLELDEIPELAARIPYLSHNGAGLTSFHDTDHLGPARRPVREKLATWLSRRGRRLGDGPVLLLTHLRVLGYVFNPVSYFYCLDPEGRLRFVVAEVNNTFGETYCYLLDDMEPLGGGGYRSRRRKAFHVSPFMGMEDISYDWMVSVPGDRITVHMDEYRGGEKYFDATLQLDRRPLTAGELGRAILRYPHVTARTIFQIHWQALKLWWKGAPVYRKPDPPADGLEAAGRAAGVAERSAGEGGGKG